MTNRYDLRIDSLIGKEQLTPDEAMGIVNEYIYNSLNKASSPVLEITSHISGALGKGVRTTLLLNSSINEDGIVPPDAVKAAAAIELLHLATLVHDDIIDDAPLRRGITSVQTKFGKKEAVISGDYLLCMAMSIATSIKSPGDDAGTNTLTAISGALSKICLGELNQYNNIGNLDLDLFNYLRIITNKTAALFYVSAYIGAAIGSSDKTQLKEISRFGLYLGIIFQILDDCKDYESDEKHALKTVGSDIANGIVTLPLIMAMKKDKSLRKAASEVIDLGADPRLLINQVRNIGGAKDAGAIVERYKKKAGLSLSKINGELKNKNLSALLDKVVTARK